MYKRGEEGYFKWGEGAKRTREVVEGETYTYAYTGVVQRVAALLFKKKKSLEQEVRQKSDISEHRSKG